MFFKEIRLSILVSLLFMVPNVLYADDLPELGEASRAVLSKQTEAFIGRSIMNEIRTREPSYIDDAQVNDYLARLQQKLVGASNLPPNTVHFFAISDPSINAFAMFGGYIGINSGLLLAAQSESEVAGVLSHEMAHVTQNHLARHFAKEKQNTIPALIALAVGVLAARANSTVAAATVASSQAGMVQAQLAYTRDFEREADRIGYQTLEKSSFDVHGMGDFFERLQKAGRLYDMSAPVYLRTHPLTTERISDMQNRAQSAPYKQTMSSLDFYLIRARLRVLAENAQDLVADFEHQLQEKKYVSEIAAQYGLTAALLKSRNIERAKQEGQVLQNLVRAQKDNSPILLQLAAEIRFLSAQADKTADKTADKNAVFNLYREALQKYPESNALVYGLIDAFIATNQTSEAQKLTENRLRSHATDFILYGKLAKIQAMQGNRISERRAQAEFYYLQGQIGAAIEQLNFAQQLPATKNDFFDQSVVDARIRELRRLQAEEEQQKRDGL